ncbi:MAG: hypothetical protein EP330_11205 [Deltaproteobacteria bacterium]|nr:MAG: hypothetical protein EP330_11205 [Deltaproteobacteria bacterium]
MRRMPMRAWLGLGLFLGACVPSPPEQVDVVGDLLGDFPGTSLGAGCLDGAVQLTWTVAAHPLIERYDAAIANESGEFERIALGAEGSGSVALASTTADACGTGCTVTLFGVNAGGDSDALLVVDLSLDGDGDGYASLTCGGGDCDDEDDATHPGATEACDGADNDCNDVVDDLANAPLANLQDGVCAGSVKVCDGNGGWTEPDYAAITDYEASEASCDGLDNDCDGTADADITTAPAADLVDGVCAGQVKVCDGTNGWIEPDYTAIATYEGTEVSCDGLDNDCSGQADDLDGAPDASEQRGVCAGAKQVCDGSGGFVDPDYTTLADYETDEASCDGLDNDCDGTVDDDITAAPAADLQAGVCAGSQKVCDGSNGWIEPNYTAISEYEAQESLCDGLDNDCSGDADDVLDPPLADIQDGVCTGATKVCDGSAWNEPDYGGITGYEADEATCDGLDNDCDGTADTDIAGTPLADKQDGVCAGTYKACDGTGFVEPDYGALIAEYEADESLCDGLDNDCDGSEDEMVPADAPLADNQQGVCQGAQKVCAGAAGYQNPDYTLIADYESPEETCDGLDNDCDGTADTVFTLDESTARLECWGAYIRSLPEKIADGPFRSAHTARAYNSGSGVSCAIDTSDQLFCWGDNWWGSLGDGTLVSRRALGQVPGAWDHVDLDYRGICGIQTDATLWCWGQELGPNSTVHPAPVQVGAGTWKKVVLDNEHACAIASDDTLWCWGRDLNRQLGLPTAGDESAPVQVGTDTWTDVAVGEGHSCGLRTSGDISCWGKNNFGQVGVDRSVDSGPITTQTAIAPPTGLTWTAIAAAGEHTCALASDDNIWCWGRNQEYQVANDSGDTFFEPQLSATGPFDTVRASETHSCGTTPAGELVCWGFDLFDGMGLGANSTSYPDPVQVGSQLGGYASAGSAVSCAVSNTDGSLWCWGSIWGRAAGPGPEQVRSVWDGVVRDIAVGEEHACLIDDADGSVWCMGRDTESDELGTVGEADTLVPVQVLTGNHVQIEAGGRSTCALRDDGTRWCWGEDLKRLGMGTTGWTQPVPVQDTDRTYKDVAMTGSGGCGIASDDTIWCWGSRSPETQTPAQLGTETWRDVTRTGRAYCAIDTSDDLYCWGYNANGQNGVNDTTTRTYAERVLVSEAGPWAAVEASNSSEAFCGLKQDQSLWCWGSSSWGRLGVGSTGNVLVPTQIPGSWQAVSIGSAHMCAQRTDGSTWCSGDNYYNQLAKEYDEEAEYQIVPLEIILGGGQTVGSGDYRTCIGVADFNEQTCN